MNAIPQTEKVREPHHKILLNKVSDQIANIIIASVLFPNKKPHRLRAHSKPVLLLRQKRFRRNASFTRITTRTLDDLSRSVGGSRRRPSAGYSGYNNTTNATAAAAASSSSSSTHILTRTLSPSLSLSLCVYAEGGGRDAARPERRRPPARRRRRGVGRLVSPPWLNREQRLRRRGVLCSDCTSRFLCTGSLSIGWVGRL